MKFNHLNVPDTWRHYWTRYPEGYTILEALISWVKQVDDMVDNVNNWNSYLDEFVSEFDKDLQGKVTNTLSEWQQSGLLEVIIDEALQTQMDTLEEETQQKLTTYEAQVKVLSDDLTSRGVNLKALGAVLDGVTDDFAIVREALDTYGHVFIPDDGVIGTTETIFIRQGQTLEGTNPTVRGYKNSPKVKYIGATDRRKAVVVLGKNDVGAEPTGDASNCQLKNVMVDANFKAGFAVYGTYLVNETCVDNVSALNSLEYNMYFARGWYATLTNLTSLNAKGKGIALGMPLEYQDGTQVQWVTPSPLELNNVKTDNIRSIASGEHYSKDNPGLYDPTNPLHRRQGYGIGAGIGNGFRLENFLSEQSGGVNLYVYTGSQPSKTIQKAYLEKSCVNSGLDPATTLPNIIIEHTNEVGEAYTIEDMFMNYNSGGIYYVGERRKVWLKNIHQPRFLTSLSGHSAYDLQQIVLKDNVYYGCGYTNTLEDLGETIVYEEVNTRYTYRVPIKPSKNWQYMIFFKGTGVAPLGNYTVKLENGTLLSQAYPDLTGSGWVHSRTVSGNPIEIIKSGGTAEINAPIMIKVVAMPPTFI